MSQNKEKKINRVRNEVWIPVTKVENKNEKVDQNDTTSIYKKSYIILYLKNTAFLIVRE